MSNKTALLIDGNNRLYASYFAYESLSYNGNSTSCIYGMPSMVRYLINDLKPARVYVIWDGHGNNKRIRQELLPTYKAHRSENSLVDLDDLIRQKLVVQKLLNLLGVRQLMNVDLEGDDLIYAVYRRIRKKYKYVVINSGDKDFHQMLSSKVKIFSESRKVMLTKDSLKSHFGYSPEETVDWLALVGDKSDDIPGLSGCGKKTARSLLDTYGSVSNFIKSGDDFPRVNRDRLLETYYRNRKLIDLEYFYSTHVRGTKLEFIGSKIPTKDPEAFIRLAAKYGVKKFMDNNFIKPF